MTAPELSPFTTDPGIDAGRIAPSAADVGVRIEPPGDATSELGEFGAMLGRSFTLGGQGPGGFLFCLGHDAPGLTGLLAPGDFVEVTQSCDFTGKTLLTFEPRTRAPLAPPPAGYSWVADVRVDGVSYGTRTLAGLPHDWRTWAANVSKVSPGAHALAFRLTLTGPALSGPPSSPVLEVEIPALYVEAVSLTAPTGPVLINAIPDPLQGISTGTGPLPSTSITFDLVDLGASGIALSTLNVYVQNAHVVTNGVAASGWTLTTTAPSSDTKRVVLTPTTPFTSGETITVAVAVQTNGATPLPNTWWTFQIADVIPPSIGGAQATGTNTIKVSWTEDVLAITPSGAHDALNPALYTLAPQIVVGGTTPAVTPSVASVVMLDSATALLTTDIELSPGIVYTLVASGVSDEAGNYATKSATFTAFVPPSPAGRSFNIFRMFPLLNRQEDAAGTSDFLRFANCLQEIVTLLLFDIDRWIQIVDIDLAPEAFVDAILSDLGNPFSFELSLVDKRRLARVLVPIYKLKGTDVGIINAIRFFMNVDVDVTSYDGEGLLLGVARLGQNWILGPGSLFSIYAFRVVSPVALSSDEVQRMTKIVKYMKPANTHLIEIQQPTQAPTYDPVELGISKLGGDWKLH